MKTEKTTRAATSVGVLAALAASLCCITPLLALLAGISGAASAFSWLEPARPYLIGVAIAALGYAWYRALSTKNAGDCGPDGSCRVEKKSFLASRTFLSLISLIAVLLMAFPYYGQIFYPKVEKKTVVVVERSNIQTASFHLRGMTCQSCEEHLNSELAKVGGVFQSQTSYEKGTVVVQFDKTKTNLEEITNAINHTGYTVKERTVVNK